MVAEFKQPKTLDEALALLAQHGDEAKVLAGGGLSDNVVTSMCVRRTKRAIVREQYLN